MPKMKNPINPAPQSAAAVRPWNGIDENTRDPLELDDNAPDVPSELDEIEPQL